MEPAALNQWPEANQRYLVAALEVVRAALEKHVAAREATTTAPEERADAEDQAARMLSEAADELPAPSALEMICETFELSSFERDLLLLCAGMELDARFASLCSLAHGNAAQAYPTLSLALAALADAHWSALRPDAPLRRWRLIEVGTGNALTLGPLRIDERILHFLTGVQYIDERLAGLIEPLRAPVAPLVASHNQVAERIVSIWLQEVNFAPPPVIQICGEEATGKRAIAAAACERLGLSLHVLHADLVPVNSNDLETLLCLWQREVVLSQRALLLDCDEFDTTDAARRGAVKRLIENIAGALIITGRERQRIRHRSAISFDVQKPATNEQRDIWQSALGKEAANLNGQVDLLVAQFNLSASAITSASTEALGGGTDNLRSSLWNACRMQARPRLDDLAQRIEPVATWDELVLPDPQRETLRDIAAHVRQRSHVYERWGFGAKGGRGLGISALFAGASGTGKTFASEVVARDLNLDLYRIDLSQVVSKYIGETEKNLRSVFDAAEEGGAVLLFDEADALFGKRSEVKDSHDRYANIEVSYLLQRMEAYRGLAILTTNMKTALDTAFIRRIRFIVQFPFPDASQRAEIWRRIFPAQTPTEGLDINLLAQLNVTGGNIRNIALNAAFLAADAGERVTMRHLLRATRSEYVKLEQPLAEVEIRGWI
jgi:hypothetical protein